ncbi:MAG: hypothetical protein R3E13_09810 [Alphaproteobacteria bacterium]
MKLFVICGLLFFALFGIIVFGAFSEPGISYLSRNMPERDCIAHTCLSRDDLPLECPAVLNGLPSFLLMPFVESHYFPKKERAQRLKACAINTLLDHRNLDGVFSADKFDRLTPDWYAFIFQKALDNGFTPAGEALGMAYLRGLGVERDEQRAAIMFLTSEMLAFPYICDPESGLSNLDDYLSSEQNIPLKLQQIRLMFSFCTMPSDELLTFAEEAFSYDNPYRESYVATKIAYYLSEDRNYSPAFDLNNKSSKEQLAKSGL